MTFQTLFDFEQKLAEYTGAPFAVVTDCGTHAIELCMRYDQVTECKLTPYTYISVPMTLQNLKIKFEYLDHAWQRWAGEYPFLGTRIWDSARRLEPNMYQSGQMQCLSFGRSKPLELGRAGAILLDDAKAYEWLSCARSDGRNLKILPWPQQKTFSSGWHYCPTLETCALGIEKLTEHQPQCQFVPYNDCRDIVLIN